MTDPPVEFAAVENDKPEKRVWVWPAVGLLAIVAIGALAWFFMRTDSDLSRSVASGLDRTSTMELVSGGIPQDVPDEVPLSGDLVASLHLTTTEQRFGRELTVRLFSEGAPDAPMTSATVRATASMQLMSHGTYDASASVGDDGSYHLPLRLDMAGDWQIDMVVLYEGEELPVLLYVSVLD
ncbi:MAG: hypothetical protein AB7V46_01150 [Thermomicrobiales bacterium]